MYKIKLTSIAAEALRKIESTARDQIFAKIDQLKIEPFLLGKALVGPLKEFRSVRAAGQRYRIIYHITDQKVIVLSIIDGRRNFEEVIVTKLMRL